MKTFVLKRPRPAAGPAAVEGFFRVHDELIDENDRAFVERLRKTIRPGARG